MAGAVEIGIERADQPEVHALLAQSDRTMHELYPAESNHLVDVATLTRPNARFLVARLGGRAVGCGSILLEADGSAEIKRMFVAPEARGLGLGRSILDLLEAIAGQEGVEVLRLETGVRSHEALGLYRGCGYAERPPFGSYRPDPLSVFMEKRLDAGRRGA
jgi:putative acetyltransferase